MTGTPYVVCGTCGTRNAVGDQFCSSDGHYLGYADSTRIDPEPASVPPPLPPAERERVGLIERVREAVTGEREPATSGAQGEPGEATAAQDGAAGPTAAAPSTPPTPLAPTPRPAPRIAQPAQPPPGPAGRAGTVQQRQPVRTDATAPPPPPRRDADTAEVVEAGDLVCGRCGSGNTPTRHYCRRCGTSLAEAPVARRQPWWRRGRRSPTPLPAGARPDRIPRRRRPPVVAVVVLALLAGAGYAFREEVVGGARWVREQASNPEPVNPVAVEASVGADSAALAFDGTNDVAWRAGPGPNEGASLTARLAEPVDLRSIIFTPGVSTVPEKYLADYRPRDLQVQAQDAGGAILVSVGVRLSDAPGPQEVEVSADGVSAVRVVSLTAYGTQGDLAVAEIELFAR